MSQRGAKARARAAKLAGAADPLVRRAARAGAVAPGVTAAGLLTLVTGITLATERHPDPTAEAHRLLGLAVEGVSPRTWG
ncbi:SbtR family transcriptional regulator [Lipingzhangella halophila]|uniref:SbtR family transcriptional regulator n=1 Tax=Lipingzhangella halophila TaxID=1783352 RepID=UPI0035E46476